MGRSDYDLFTIGAGSGGVRASRVSAAFGARVAVAEERYLGGTCVNVGCIPKKLLVYSAHFRGDFEDSESFGWAPGDRRFDWPALVANKDREVARLNGVYRDLLDAAGVKRIEGHARILDPHTVEVGSRRFTADHILVATGSWPSVPEVPGAEHGVTSNEAFHLKSLPRRVVIVGGGYIAVEFAGIFRGLGAEVVQLYRGPLFLRGFDDDLRETLADEMRKKGVDLRFEARLARIDRDDTGVRATLEDGSAVEGELILFATGRHPLTANLGLEEAGVALDETGAIAVDEFSRSSAPSIWAIGDVTNRLNLTPVAIHEGIALANTLFNDCPTAPDHETVPTAVFSDPNLGTVGLTEAQARDRNTAIDIYRSGFRALKHTLTGRDEKTLMKLVVDANSDKVLGVHMIGPDAGEIMQGFGVALKAGATKAQFDATIGIHPTLAEEFVTMRQKAAEG